MVYDQMNNLPLLVEVRNCLFTYFIAISTVYRTSYLGDLSTAVLFKQTEGGRGLSISQDIPGCGIDLAVGFQRTRICVRVCKCMWCVCVCGVLRCICFEMSASRMNVCARVRV